MYDSINDKLKPQALALMKERLNKDELYFINRGKYLRPRALLFYKAIEGDIISKIKYFSWITIRSLYRKLKSLIK